MDVGQPVEMLHYGPWEHLSSLASSTVGVFEDEIERPCEAAINYIPNHCYI
jgi:hypothetical protein